MDREGIDQEIDYEALPISIIKGKWADAVPRYVSTSLYIADLDSTTSEEDLFELFKDAGQVQNIKISKDAHNGAPLGHGYVTFRSTAEAIKAKELFNYERPNAHCKPMRLIFSNQDASSRYPVKADLFIQDLEDSISSKDLDKILSGFGVIVSCKVPVDDFGRSKGYGYVQFENEESAQRVIETLNGKLINGKKVYVGPFIPRMSAKDKILTNHHRFANLYVTNISVTTTEEDLRERFGKFGAIRSTVVMRNAKGISRCFGFVNFEEAEAATDAFNAFNGKAIDDQEWYVGRAQKKNERQAEVLSKYQPSMMVSEDVDPLNKETTLDTREYETGTDNCREHFSTSKNTDGTGEEEMEKITRKGKQTLEMPDLESTSESTSETRADGASIISKEHKAIDPMRKPVEVTPVFVARVPVDSVRQFEFFCAQEKFGPLPWSTEILTSALASTRVPEERSEIIGSILYSIVLPFEHNYTGHLVEMLKELDIGEIMHMMELKRDALQVKVREAKAKLLLEMQRKKGAADDSAHESKGTGFFTSPSIYLNTSGIRKQ